MEVPEEDLRENSGFFSGNLSSVVTIRWYQGLEKAAEEGFITENIRDVEKVINRGDEWDKLAAPFASPLLDSDWFIAGAKAFCPPNNLAVIVLKSGRKLKAIAPFNIKGALFPHLELIGSSTLREPGGLIYDSQKSLEALVKVMLDANKSLLLKRFYKSSAEVPVLERELKKTGTGI